MQVANRRKTDCKGAEQGREREWERDFYTMSIKSWNTPTTKLPGSSSNMGGTP